MAARISPGLSSWVRPLDKLPESVLLLADDGRVRWANHAAAALWSHLPDELAGARLHDLVADPEAQVDRLLATWKRSGSLLPSVLTVRGGDRKGRHRAHGGSVLGSADEDGPLLLLRLSAKPESAQVFELLNQRIADLTNEVARRQRAEGLLAEQKVLLEMIARGEPLAAVLTAIVELIERRVPGSLGSILLVDPEDRLRHGAAPSLPAAYNQAIDGVAIGPDVGSCGTATFLREPVTVVDIASDRRWRDYKDVALEHGLRACWSWPVLSAAGEAIGSVAMYYAHPAAPDGRAQEMTGVARDLAAIAIERARAEHALEERAAALAEADRRKDEFLAMLAHELRNPLSPIMATIEILRATAASPSYASSSDSAAMSAPLDVIERQTRHLTRLVDDLLDVSRISRGQIDLVVGPVDLTTVARDAASGVCWQAERAGQELTVDLGDGPVWVEGDPDRLTQVIHNLLSNALRYTPAGGHIALTLTREEGQAALRVRDDGCGIEPERLDSMFELFVQGQHSLRRSGGGLGIGLTLVKTLTEAHGGTVTGQSDGPGKGSEFTVVLPLAATPSEEEGEPASAQPAAAAVPAVTHRVLVVEDNQDSATAMAAMLELWGYRAHVVSDGLLAVERALELRPDAILCDIGLPGIDGYQVARRLRAEGLDSSYLVALTGYGRPEDRQKAHDAGFDHHLTKPIDPGLLRELLGALGSEP